MTSFNIYAHATQQQIDAFKPTFLYIMQHRVTGKLYFGKSVRTYENFLKYNGSGSLWKNHIKKHGIEHVEKIWWCYFIEIEPMIEFALTFSSNNNIVESTEWANIVIETGVDGGSIKGWKNEKLSHQRAGGSGAKDVITGEQLGIIHKDDPRWLSGEIVGIRDGTIQSESTKLKIGAGLKNSTQWQSYMAARGPVVVGKDKDGNKFHISTHDPRYLSGEVVHALLGYKINDELRAKYRKLRSGAGNPAYGTKMYNNGLMNKRFKIGAEIPEGFTLGKLK